jgi:hypothetical protein
MPNTSRMGPDVVQALNLVVHDLVPQLDAAGFHITRIGLSDGGRYSIGYCESVESIPDVLVDAVAAVTRTGVDFDHGGAIAIALLTRQHLDSLVPRRPAVSIEELVAARAR